MHKRLIFLDITYFFLKILNVEGIFLQRLILLLHHLGHITALQMSCDFFILTLCVQLCPVPYTERFPAPKLLEFYSFIVIFFYHLGIRLVFSIYIIFVKFLYLPPFSLLSVEIIYCKIVNSQLISHFSLCSFYCPIVLSFCFIFWTVSRILILVLISFISPFVPTVSKSL